MPHGYGILSPPRLLSPGQTEPRPLVFNPGYAARKWLGTNHGNDRIPNGLGTDIADGIEVDGVGERDAVHSTVHQLFPPRLSFPHASDKQNGFTFGLGFGQSRRNEIPRWVTVRKTVVCPRLLQGVAASGLTVLRR